MKLASLYNPYLFHKSIDTNMQKENMDSIKEKKTKNWDFYMMKGRLFLAKI